MDSLVTNPRAVLWDLDGTLVDTVADIAFALNQTLLTIGVKPINQETCFQFVGHGLKNTLTSALDYRRVIDLDPSKIEVLYANFLSIYREPPHNYSIPYHGISNLLQKCVAEKLPMGVLSNKEDSLVKRIVRHLFGDVNFQFVRGAVDGCPLKPDSTAVHMFLDLVQCRPNESLLVGDSEVDYETARSAGMRCVLVTWGFRSRSILASQGLGPLIDTIEELEMEVLPWQ